MNTFIFSSSFIFHLSQGYGGSGAYPMNTGCDGMTVDMPCKVCQCIAQHPLTPRGNLEEYKEPK